MRKKISKKDMKKTDEINGAEPEEELYVERIRLESMDMRFVFYFLYVTGVGLMYHRITGIEDPCFKFICNFTNSLSCLILLLL